ncbi:MAG: ABC transporter substrate-binding protein [Propionibacteriaceae bacterium]|jgi:NitT/TauT family transport system substrate-binding protein|nr:ABC transporter substrate-binding protein [Propionibacteriaceae bacterium]
MTSSAHRSSWGRLIAALTVGLTLLAGCGATGATGTESPSASTVSSGTQTPADTATPVEGIEPPVIGLTYVPNIQFAPFYVAEDDGLLAGAAAGAELRHHGASEGLFTALASGAEQFVVAGGDEILQARAEGVDVVAVSAYYHRYPARIIVPADSPIQTMADLRGHTVGLPGRFGENWFALLIGLEQAGLSLDDVTVEEIGYTQQAALMTGKVDAVVGFSNGDAISFEQAGFATRSIDPEPPLVSICLATTSAYAEANPRVVADVVGALDAAIASVSEDPEHALDIAAGHIPDFTGEATIATARAVLDATIDLFAAPDGRVAGQLDEAQWQTMAEAMDAAGLLSAPVDGAEAMTNQYRLRR